ncbi:MAG: hypothetical protein OEW83_18450 [Acidimicrobiia bacterium]|nr:hypothetical protein [Acidimicrobiia bacterium]
MKYVTRFDRFVAGDFPMVCVRSGRAATRMVPVQATRSASWPWLFLVPAPIMFFAAKLVGDGDDPCGRLPFAEGQVGGVTAVYDKRVGVILRGVHKDFVAATRRAQGKSADG